MVAEIPFEASCLCIYEIELRIVSRARDKGRAAARVDISAKTRARSRTKLDLSGRLL